MLNYKKGNNCISPDLPVLLSFLKPRTTPRALKSLYFLYQHFKCFEHVVGIQSLSDFAFESCSFHILYWK